MKLESVQLDASSQELLGLSYGFRYYFFQNYRSILGFTSDIFSSRSLLYVTFRHKWSFNPLSSHDAIKHHFKFLKTDLIFLQLRVFEEKFP